jgi:hypothetical protein
MSITKHRSTFVWLVAFLITLAAGCDLIANARHADDSDTNGNGAATDNDGSATTGDQDADGTDATSEGDGGTHSGAIIADHKAAAAFTSIPSSYIASVPHAFSIFYGHTSHGSQLITGLDMVARELREPESPHPFVIQEYDGDLGTEGDLAWVDATRSALDAAGNQINLVMWSWCGGVSGNTEAGIDAYLSAMDQLAKDYPAVTFVYMTGHLDGTGPDENLYRRNEQIRAWCRDGGRVLFDFADIESYDPDGNYYADGSDACEWCATWCAQHDCPDCNDCAHSHCFNCYQKGRALWWMLARLAGWTG